jgi:hypothetical protein
MTSARLLVLIVGFFVAATAWAQEGQHTVQKPLMQVGDEWTYNVTANGLYLGKHRYTYAGKTTFRGKPALHLVSKLIEARSDSVKSFIENSDLFFTPEWAWFGRNLGSGRYDYAEPPLPLAQWPLGIGKQWSDIVSFYFEYDNFTQIQTRFQVIAYETVTVPAGTFEAFRLNYRAFHPDFPGSGTVIDYWYSPGVKSIVKYRGIVWFENIDFLYELVSYQLKD